MPRLTLAEFNAYQARRAAGRPVPELEAPTVERESELQAAIATECRRRGWLAFTGNMAVATSRTVGEPDFCIAADDGRVFWVEAKTKTGKLSLEQLAAHAWLRRLGQSVYVVRNFGEFIQAAENKAEPAQ